MKRRKEIWRLYYVHHTYVNIGADGKFNKIMFPVVKNRDYILK